MSPAKSKAQAKLMGADLARKRAGKKTRTGMSEKQLKEFASTSTKGLPEHVSKKEMKHMMTPKQMEKMMKPKGKKKK